ncbi:MAG: MFS transporter [Magnetococcus sp. YQC-3]
MNPPTGQSGLLRTRRFLPLFVTQFMGALNDNVVKNALVVLLTFHAAEWTTLLPAVLANLAAGIFILPFFLFSATAGQLADKFDKAKLARLVKLLEVVIILIIGGGFALHSVPILFAALFLLGLHSTLFGPIKYAILPQHLHEEELVGGNALIEAGTFVAILCGTLLGGLLAGSGDLGSITLVGVLIAVTGYLASRAIPSAAPPEPSLRINPHFLGETWKTLQLLQGNRALFLSILGISWFWLYGALFLAQFPAYARHVLGGGESAVTLLLATFTVGISLGSLLCERLSAGRVELGLVPFGSIGLTLFGLDFAVHSLSMSGAALPQGITVLLAQPAIWRILVDLLLLGAFGGFFIVPLYALVQQRSEVSHRARIIAANNIYNALFMVVGAMAAAAMLGNGLSIPALFATAALCNAAVAVYIYGLLPEFLLRFVVWLLLHSLVRLRTHGLEKIPESGPLLLVCAPLTSIDALIVMGACRRPIRFVVGGEMRLGWLTSFVFTASGAIRHDPPPADGAFSEATLANIQGALAAGAVVGGPSALGNEPSLANLPRIDLTLEGERRFFSSLTLSVVHPPP